MWKFISNLILKNRIVIIILIAMLTVFMIQKGKEAKLSYSMAKLLPESHQFSIDYNNFLEKYGVQNLLVIAVEDSLITTLSHLKKWDLLSDYIKRINGVEQLVSFSNLPIISKDIKSILIVRNNKTEISAYLNICSHRGAKLVEGSGTKAYAFKCPYHSWIYNLNGELKARPRENAFEEINKDMNKRNSTAKNRKEKVCP